MVEIKKQVAETSNQRPFRTFKKTESKPPNVISNADSEQDEEEEEFFRLHDYSKNMKARLDKFSLKHKADIWWEDMKNSICNNEADLWRSLDGQGGGR